MKCLDKRNDSEAGDICSKISEIGIGQRFLSKNFMNDERSCNLEIVSALSLCIPLICLAVI